MADDENPEIAAALAELAGEDPSAASDADAAIEWIAGEQGLALITQERVQNFVWYFLPMKWMTGVGGKVAVAEALARALDLLGLPSYAAICRSGTTRAILSAYEVSLADGKSAFRRANVASGIQPCDLPEFEWGATMGFQEASAISATADFLELAVASGDLVPGARGWKTRQQELVRTHLNIGRVELVGQSLAQLILTERTETWVNLRGSETRRKILAGVANRLLHPAELPAEAAADPLPPLRWLLGQLDGGIALTQTGNLNRKFVQAAADRFRWDFPSPPRTEDELFDLHQLRHLAQRLRLARRQGRTLTLTAKGRRAVAEPDQLWRAAARGLLGGSDFSVFAGELVLALLLDTDSMPYDQIKTIVAQAAAQEGFRQTRSGAPPTDHEVGRAGYETTNLCRALALLSVGGDWNDRSYGLTRTGKAAAVEALRARATGPAAIPRA
jgi:hypothetical protein